MTTTEINKRFAELVGLCWHELLVKHGAITGCSCGENRHTLYYAHQNPDYCADSRLVLEVMKGRKDYLAFLDSCLPPFTSSRAAVTAHWVDIFMDKTGQLSLEDYLATGNGATESVGLLGVELASHAPILRRNYD